MENQDPNRRPPPGDPLELSAISTSQAQRPQGVAPENVVFDFKGQPIGDLASLCLILTARQLADDRAALVWIKNTTPRTWALLRGLGVDGLFALFPQPDVTPS